MTIVALFLLAFGLSMAAGFVSAWFLIPVCLLVVCTLWLAATV